MTIGLLLALTYRTTTRAEIRTEICQGVKANNNILEDLLVRAKAATVEEARKEGKNVPKAREEAEAFFGPALHRTEHIKSIPC